jgi:hypothetical protein
MMKMRGQKKKHYYPIGLISLILLPTFCIWYLYNCKAFKKTRVMEINWGSNFKNELIPFDVHPEREFVDFHITGNDKANKIILDSSQIEIRKLISTKDSTKGVHFIFNNDSKYWALIKAMDICFIENARCFVPKGNDLWVFNYTSKPRIKMDHLLMSCGGTGPMRCVPYIESNEEIAEMIKEKRKYIFETVKSYFYSLLLFIIMIYLAVKQIVRNYKSNISRRKVRAVISNRL